MDLSPNSDVRFSWKPDVKMCLESEFQEDSKSDTFMKVYGRVRPMLDRETEAGYNKCIFCLDEQQIRAVVPEKSVKSKNNPKYTDYTYSLVLGPEIGQFTFFERTTLDIMQDFIKGKNCLIFSYGITNSGKTFTLQGDNDNPGIIPLALRLFFAATEHQLIDTIKVKAEKFADISLINEKQRMQEENLKNELLKSSDLDITSRKSEKSTSKRPFAMVLCDFFHDGFEPEDQEETLPPDEMQACQSAAVMKQISKESVNEQTGSIQVWVSFIEIYNNQIYDLFYTDVFQRPKLSLGEDKNGDVYVKGAKEVCVSNSEDALKLLYLGRKNLRIASTKLNYQSSRSHCIYTIKVVRLYDDAGGTARVNRLSFCDLAGSERAKKAEATGNRLKEACFINTSLMVLGKCLHQLRDAQKENKERLIAFRESKLTRLFSGHFTGKGKAIMIANVSPCEYTFEETLHVLDFSALAQEITLDDNYLSVTSSTLLGISSQWAEQKSRNSVDYSINQSMESVEYDSEIEKRNRMIEELLSISRDLRSKLEIEKKENHTMERDLRANICTELFKQHNEMMENERKAYDEEKAEIEKMYKNSMEDMKERHEKKLKEMKEMYEMEESICESVDGNTTLEFNKEELNTLKEELVKKTEAHEALIKELEDKSNLVALSEKKNTELEAALKNAKNEYENLEKEMKSVSESAESSKRLCLDRVGRASEVLRNAINDKSQHAKEKAELNSALRKANTNVAELERELDLLKRECAVHKELAEKAADGSGESSQSISAKLLDDVRKATIENDVLKKENDIFKKENDALKKENYLLDDKCSFLKNETANIAIEHEISEKKFAEMIVDVKQRCTKIVDLNKEIKILKDECSLHKNEKEKIENELAKSSKENGQLVTDLEKVTTDANDIRKELETLKNEYSSHKNEASKAAAELEIATKEEKEKLLALENQVAALEQQVKDKEEMVKELMSKTQEMKVLQKKLDESNSLLQEASKEKEQIVEQNTKLKAEFDASKESHEVGVVALKQELAAANAIYEELSEQLSSAQKEHETEILKYKTDLDALKDAEEQLKALKEKVQSRSCCEKVEAEKAQLKAEYHKKLQDQKIASNAAFGELSEKLSNAQKEHEAEIIKFKADLDSFKDTEKEIETLREKVQSKSCCEKIAAEKSQLESDYLKKLEDQTALSQLQYDKLEAEKLKLDTHYKAQFQELKDTHVQNTSQQEKKLQEAVANTKSLSEELAELQKERELRIASEDEILKLQNKLAALEDAAKDVEKNTTKDKETLLLKIKELKDSQSQGASDVNVKLQEAVASSEALKEKISAIEKDLDVHKTKAQTLEDQLAASNAKIEKVQTEKVEADKVYAEKIKVLEGNLPEANKENVCDHESLIEELKTKVDDLQKESEKYKSNSEQSSDLLAKTQKNVEELNSELVNEKNEAKSNLEKDQLLLLLEHCELNATNKMKSLDRHLQKQTDELRDMGRQVMEKEASIEELERALVEKQNEIKKVKSTLEQKIQELTLKNSELEKEITEFKKGTEADNISQTSTKSSRSRLPRATSSKEVTDIPKVSRPKRNLTQKQLLVDSDSDDEFEKTSTSQKELNMKSSKTSRKRVSEEEFMPSSSTKRTRGKKDEVENKIPPARAARRKLQVTEETQSPVKKMANFVGSKMRSLTQNVMNSPIGSRTRQKKLFNVDAGV